MSPWLGILHPVEEYISTVRNASYDLSFIEKFQVPADKAAL
jgi:hypothetical protein